MYQLNIISADRYSSIPDGVDLLRVSFSITRTLQAGKKKKKEVEEVYSGSHAFPLETSEDDIRRDLGRFLDTYVADLENAAASAESESISRQADETIASLKGSTINAEAHQ